MRLWTGPEFGDYGDYGDIGDLGDFIDFSDFLGILKKLSIHRLQADYLKFLMLKQLKLVWILFL